jgi:hypothetical protein
MEMHETVKLLGIICEEVVEELNKHRIQHACIHGSAVLTKVLRGVAFPEAYPLAVGVRIFNKAYQEWVDAHGIPGDDASADACDDAGGSIIFIGKETEPPVDRTRWHGHLAVVIPMAFGDRHAFLDLTITQANRPDRGIELQPVCFRVRDEFVRGSDSVSFEVKGTLLIYKAYPEDFSYNDDGDCLAMEGIDEVVSAVIQRLKSSESV